MDTSSDENRGESAHMAFLARQLLWTEFKGLGKDLPLDDLKLAFERIFLTVNILGNI